MELRDLATVIGIAGALVGLGAAWGMFRAKGDAVDLHAKKLDQITSAVDRLTERVDLLTKHSDSRIGKLENVIDDMRADVFAAMRSK